MEAWLPPLFLNVTAQAHAPAAILAALDDEALCRLALRDDLPTLGLSLDGLLRRALLEKVA